MTTAPAAQGTRRAPTRRAWRALQIWRARRVRQVRRIRLGTGRGHDDRGANAIEFAITVVAVMAIIFTAIQAATYFWARSIALAAAEEAVTAQRVYHAAPGAGHARAISFLASTGDGLTSTTVTVTSDGTQVHATVAGSCLSVIPGFCNAFPVSATAHGMIERIT